MYSSWGPLGWVVAAEQFPLNIAPLCVSLATASNWVSQHPMHTGL